MISACDEEDGVDVIGGGFDCFVIVISWIKSRYERC